jgi:hypothetical protein
VRKIIEKVNLNFKNFLNLAFMEADAHLLIKNCELPFIMYAKLVSCKNENIFTVLEELYKM